MKASTWLSTLIACLGLASSGAGADNTWKNSPDGTFQWGGFNWDSPLSWNDGDDAIFGPSGVGAITLGIPVIAHNLTFNFPGYSIVGNTLTLGGTTPTITANENVIIATRLLGSNGLRILGSSNVTLIGTPGVGGNQYTGGTYVVSGTVILQVSNLVNGTTYAIDSIEALDSGATVKYFNDISYTATTNNLRVPEGQLPINANTKLNLTGGTFDLNGDDNQNRQPMPTPHHYRAVWHQFKQHLSSLHNWRYFEPELLRHRGCEEPHHRRGSETQRRLWQFHPASHRVGLHSSQQQPIPHHPGV